MMMINKMKQLQKGPQNHSASSEKRFFHHFQSINNPVKIPPTFASQKSLSKNKYNETLEVYGSTVSIIDKIADSPIRESKIILKDGVGGNFDFVTNPLIVSLNQNVKEKILSINRFFNYQFKKEAEGHRKDDWNLNGYIAKILSINVKSAGDGDESRGRSKSRSNSKSRSKQFVRSQSNDKRISVPQATPPKRKPMEAKGVDSQVNTDPLVPTQRTVPKLKKTDLLLMDIMRQKKRKGLVPDYYRAIEMKLVELLEHILHDQPEYFGLALVDKMKAVLKNLERFKGKTVDGESKVQLLRIFFQEFRNLKKQREEEDRGSENREKSSSQKIKKQFQTNQIHPPLRPAKKQKRNSETLSVGGQKSTFTINNKKTNKSVLEEDQWMGSLS